MDLHNVKSGAGGLVCFTKYKYSEMYPCCVNSSFKFIAQLHKIRHTHIVCVSMYDVLLFSFIRVFQILSITNKITKLITFVLSTLTALTEHHRLSHLHNRHFPWKPKFIVTARSTSNKAPS